MKRSSTYSGFVSTNISVQAVQVKNEILSLHKSFFPVSISLFSSSWIPLKKILLIVEKPKYERQMVYGAIKTGWSPIFVTVFRRMQWIKRDTFCANDVGTFDAETWSSIFHFHIVLVQSEMGGWQNPPLLCKWAGAIHMIMILQAPEFSEHLEQSVPCLWGAHRWLMCPHTYWGWVGAEGRCAHM